MAIWMHRPFNKFYLFKKWEIFIDGKSYAWLKNNQSLQLPDADKSYTVQIKVYDSIFNLPKFGAVRFSNQFEVSSKGDEDVNLIVSPHPLINYGSHKIRLFKNSESLLVEQLEHHNVRLEEDLDKIESFAHHQKISIFTYLVVFLNLLTLIFWGIQNGKIDEGIYFYAFVAIFGIAYMNKPERKVDQGEFKFLLWSGMVYLLSVLLLENFNFYLAIPMLLLNLVYSFFVWKRGHETITTFKKLFG